MVFPTHSVPLDGAFQFADGATITTSGVTQVGGSDVVMDLGDDRYISGQLVIDVTAVDTTTGDEFATISWQVSDSSSFASYYEITLKQVANGAGRGYTGRYALPVDNVATVGVGESKPMRYLRCRANVSGTTPSIDPTIHLSIDQC